MPFSDRDTTAEQRPGRPQLNGAGDSYSPPGSASSRLQTPADLLAVLQQQVEAVRLDPAAGTLEKARVIGGLAGVALRAIEVGNLAARAEMLEAVLKQRSG